MPKKTAPPLPTLKKSLLALGENLKLARLRRRITTTMLSERAGMSRTTLRKIEQGDPSVTMGAYGSVLFCLGLEKDLDLLAANDPLGRRLQDAGLTRTKHRVPKRKTS